MEPYHKEGASAKSQPCRQHDAKYAVRHTPSFVGRNNPVGHHKSNASQVLRQHARRYLYLHFARKQPCFAGKCSSMGFTISISQILLACSTMAKRSKPTPVSIFLLQGKIAAVRFLVKLGKDEVPHFQKAVTITPTRQSGRHNHAQSPNHNISPNRGRGPSPISQNYPFFQAVILDSSPILSSNGKASSSFLNTDIQALLGDLVFLSKQFPGQLMASSKNNHEGKIAQHLKK